MPNSKNLLLASLSASDTAALRPPLKPIHLDHEKVLFEAWDSIPPIYFPTGSILPLVLALSSGALHRPHMVGTV